VCHNPHEEKRQRAHRQQVCVHWKPSWLRSQRSGESATASGCVSCGPVVAMGAICA
jgi:hypothetical protein